MLRRKSSERLKGFCPSTVALPEEAGNLFAFLASDQASYITGQTIDFDGGMSL